MMTDERWVVVDGRRFHFAWLLDACLCPRCVEPLTGERLRAVGSAATPASVTLDDEHLLIEWDEPAPHVSRFEVEWLRARAYDCAPEPPPDGTTLLPAGAVPWTAETWLGDAPPRFAATGPFEAWCAFLARYGFVILDGLSGDTLYDFVADLGPLLRIGPDPETTIWSVVAGGGDDDLAYDAAGIPLAPHTDQTCNLPSDFVQFLCCDENEAQGGDALVVDGFAVAADFARQAPEAFELLSSMPVAFHAMMHSRRGYYHLEAPVIRLDGFGRLSEIRFNPHRRAPLRAPFEVTERLIRAHDAFVERAFDERYAHRFRYRPGECLVVQNFRVLHGRDGFAASTGARRLSVAYCQWTHVLARWRYARRQARA